MNELDQFKESYKNLIDKTIYRVADKPTGKIIGYQPTDSSRFLLGKFPIYEHELVIEEIKIDMIPRKNNIYHLLVGKCFMTRKEAEEYIEQHKET